jgi:hypothetical protein
MKFYIEDLLCELNGYKIKLASIDVNVVSSLSMNPMMGKGYSEKQRNLVLRLCKKYRGQLSSLLGQGVENALDTPEFKFSLIEPAPTEKSIKVEGKQIFVKFPYNDELVTKIKKFREISVGKTVSWDADKKAWVFDMEENNVLWISSNLASIGFLTDDVFNSTVEKITTILEKIEDFLPMLVEDDGEYKFINAHRSVPQPNTNDPIQALLLAKHYGISVWDEKVAKSLEMRQNSEILTSFLNESTPLSLEFDSSEKSIDQFKDLFKYNTPALIIVPGHDEFFTLKSWVLWLKEQNIDEKDMSVLFRLPNDSGSMFNDLVKSFNLNSPIGENTKIVFISQKLPKPLLKSGIEFKFIINLGSISGVHYSLSNYLQDRMDVIKYTDKKKTGYQFGLL